MEQSRGRGGSLLSTLLGSLGSLAGFGLAPARGGFWQTKRGYTGGSYFYPPPFYPTGHPRIDRRYMIP